MKFFRNILAKFVAYYKGIKLRFKKNPRKGRCECCGRRGRTQIHHWVYLEPKEKVKKNPKLALKGTSELCPTCHRLADALVKFIEEWPYDIYEHYFWEVLEDRFWKLLDLRRKAIQKCRRETV